MNRLIPSLIALALSGLVFLGGYVLWGWIQKSSGEGKQNPLLTEREREVLSFLSKSERARRNLVSIILYQDFRKSLKEIKLQVLGNRDFHPNPEKIIENIRSTAIRVEHEIPMDQLRKGYYVDDGFLIALVPELGYLPRAFIAHSNLSGGRSFQFDGIGWVETQTGIRYDIRTGCTAKILGRQDCLLPYRAEFKVKEAD